MSHSTDADGSSNPIVSEISNDVEKVRADEDQVELTRAHQALGPKAIEKLEVGEARLQPTVAHAVQALLRSQGRPAEPEHLAPGVGAVEIEVGGASGPLPATLYTPIGTGGAGPVVLYFHGGGWVIADRKVYDGGARGLAQEAQAIVVSVDYRQAPEHKFPAAWEDALAAYRWLTLNAHTLGGDPARLALAGESAGGTLAVATAIAARDAGLPAPRHVLSVYPVAQTCFDTDSYLENAFAKPLNRAMVKWFIDHLAASDDDLSDPRVSLIDADLRGLPPATIINARIDPLRSDGAKLAQAFEEAGVAVERREYEGVAHEFFGAAAVLEKARDAQRYAGERLRVALSG